MATRIAVDVTNADTSALVIAITTALGYDVNDLTGTNECARNTYDVVVCDQLHESTCDCTTLPRIVISATLELSEPLRPREARITLPLTAQTLRETLADVTDD
ncbi:MAG: hypothetical protein WD360_02625 [Nitriliruptoraceae bacterium]